MGKRQVSWSSLKFQKASPGVKYLEECLLRKVFALLAFNLPYKTGESFQAV